MAKKKKKGRPDDEMPSKKKKPRKVVDEDIDDEDEGYDEPDRSTKPRNNIYVGLGGITLLAFLLGATFLYLDHDEMGKKPAPTASVTVNDLKLGRGQAGQ